jgi:hypothetical protein
MNLLLITVHENKNIFEDLVKIGLKPEYTCNMYLKGRQIREVTWFSGELG